MGTDTKSQSEQLLSSRREWTSTSPRPPGQGRPSRCVFLSNDEASQRSPVVSNRPSTLGLVAWSLLLSRHALSLADSASVPLGETVMVIGSHHFRTDIEQDQLSMTSLANRIAIIGAGQAGSSVDAVKRSSGSGGAAWLLGAEPAPLYCGQHVDCLVWRRLMSTKRAKI